MPHKLLLADDSVTIQRVIELTFADEDVQVATVGDGKKAIASIQADRPDIVLADVGMPERDGYEVAAFIKGNPQYAHIPVLLLTGAFEPIDETRARAVGCDGVLVKPFEPHMVINRVKDLLAGRRPTGLWSGNQSAQKPAADAPRASDPPPAASPAPAPPGASLEDYFDRLDAAFASVEAATDLHASPPGPPPPASFGAAPGAAPTASAAGAAASMDPLAGWDPDLIGDPQKPASVATAAAAVSPPLIHRAPPPAVEESPAVVPAEPPAAAPMRTAIPFKSPAPPATAPAASVPAAASTASPVPPPREEPAPAPVAAQAPPPSAPLVAASAAEVFPSPSSSPALEAAYHAPVPSAAPAPPVAAPPASAAAEPPRAAPVAGAVMPSLAQAFATLLSTEQGHAITPSSVGQPGASVSEQTVDDIVQRVIARMADQSVRDTVINVAERLVREEIDRIKAGHHNQ